MVALPLTLSLPDDSTMVDQAIGQPSHLQKRRPSARRMRSDDTDTYRPTYRSISAWPRQQHGLTGDGSHPSSLQPALVRGLAATKRFFFAEDKTRHGEYVPNYRYWPILSGLIVPFAILLEVPGLTSHWYIRTDGYKTIEYQDNPPILYTAMAISMTLAVIANICLIIRFLERRIYAMTVAAIICLIIHDAINIAVITTFGVVHRFDDGFTYSQTFWMTVCSTIASVITTITLLLDYYRTPNFAKSGSGLTRKQRSLVIIFMVLLADLAVGALVYGYLLDIDYLDSLYFSVVSSFTIGFGDIAPTTTSAKVFSVFYNTIGILNTGLFIAIARSTIVESFEQSYRRRRHLMRARKRLHQQKAARAKRASHNLHSAFAQMATVARAGTGVSITGADAAAVRPDSSDTAVKPDSLDDKANAEREAAAYQKFREEMAEEEKKEFRAKLWVSWGLFTAFWVIGSAIFMVTEGWTYGTAMYFCFVAFSTVGYGDIAPLSGKGRAIFIVWAVVSVASMTVLISVLAEAYQSRYSTIMRNDLFHKQIRGLDPLSRRNSNSAEDEKSNRRYPTGSPGELPVDARIEARECVQQELAGLPVLILQDARDFQVHIRYLGNPNPGHGDKLPPGLERVLQKTMDQEKMNEAMRKQALHDGAAKKALMMLHLEKTVQGLVDKAERLAVLLAERDILEQEPGEQDVAVFDEELDGVATPAEAIVGEEEDRRIGDEEMNKHWVME